MTAIKATINDATQIHQMVNALASQGEMLARPLSEIYENIRDYFVIRQGEKVVACAGLHVNWADLAEIKSLAVNPENQNQGLGEELVAACLAEAGELGIATIFCLTYKPNFFQKCGFTLVKKTDLPHKVWGECYRCPKFPDCDEEALILYLEKES